MLVIGLGALTFALIWMASSLVATHGMTRVEGTVVRFDQDGRAWRSYQPVVAFTTTDGRHEEVTGGTSSTQPAYDIGQPLRVFYDPSAPGRSVIIDDFGQRWFPVAVVAVLGAVFSGIGLAFYKTDCPSARSRKALSHAQRKRKRNRQNLMVCLIPIVIGAAFLMGSAAAVMHERRIIASFRHAQGHVVNQIEIEPHYKPHSYLYSAVVVFRTNTGRQITFVQGSSSRHNDLREGEVVDVLYDEDTPERAMIDSFWEHWGLAAILFAIGLPFFAMGVFFVSTIDFSGRSRKRASSSNSAQGASEK
nr:DUF3592 domain-containing protein [Paraburkholderia fungorum]